jgi:Rad3-related DNA helicase
MGIDFISNEIQNGVPSAKNRSNILVPVEYKHCLIEGMTGCGKTTGAIYPNLKNRIITPPIN